MTATIGVLALQGDFAEHKSVLERIGAEVREIRVPHDLNGLKGLVIPGGESTTIGGLLETYRLLEPIRELGTAGLPIWGTCAGLILLAKDVGRAQPVLGLMDICVERNAFGRQMESFETALKVRNVLGGPFPAVFIRAPVVVDVGACVDVLARLDDGRIVAVQEDHLLGTAFHPELTNDARMHEVFVQMTKVA